MVAINNSLFAIASIFTTLLATVTEAHLSMTVSKSDDATYVTTAIRVPHGCTGADNTDTTAITVTIPAGINRLQVGYIPGWNVTTQTEVVSPPVTMGKSQINSRVSTVRWEGGPLPHGQFLDFGLRLFLPEAAEEGTSELLFFPIIQECTGGRDYWNQVPGTDGYNSSLERDAPHIEINTVADDTPWTENRLVNGKSSSAPSLVQNSLASLMVAAVAAYYLI
ncbi:MAG: hypothetical protein EXX96DRAFT_42056 [Benjaminiella poitrasii]|nr:MAG: hypothetical protein EXX96DRAFT_42056 [Benjaminiella poitrasii]